MTPRQLTEALDIPLMRAAEWASLLTEAMAQWRIETPRQQAAFIAQVGHESALLTRLKENLNYSAYGLFRTFPKYFTAKQAWQYARKPEAIANRVYANRIGNGDDASGDGWTYRGHGLIQITGKDNHHECGLALGIDLINHPELLCVPEYAAMSAAWYWVSRGCNPVAEKGDFAGVTRIINGGLNGQNERLALLTRSTEALA